MTDQPQAMREAFEAWADGFTADQYPFYSRGVPTSVSAPLRSQLRSAWQAATQAERERAAKVAERHENSHGYTTDTGMDIAAAIRKG